MGAAKVLSRWSRGNADVRKCRKRKAFEVCGACCCPSRTTFPASTFFSVLSRRPAMGARVVADLDVDQGSGTQQVTTR